MAGRAILKLALATALSIAQHAYAHSEGALLALPDLAQCSSKTHPLLPEKWHATYLMAPFEKAQLALSDIVYDGAVPAMRVRLYGLKHGSADLFVRGRNTYQLSGDGAARCRNLGDTGWSPLPRDWLARNARCEGSAPIAGLALDWWKTPSSAHHTADWIWYERAGPSPFRLMITQPSNWLSILSWYSFSYRVRFDALRETGLAAIADSCDANKQAPPDNSRAELQKLLSGMESSTFRSDAEISALMPELNAACPAAPLPGWPDRAAMTAIMTPPDFSGSPMPTEVLYDGQRKMQRTRNVWPPRSDLATDDALLLDGHGFSVARTRTGRLICTAGLPGALRPNWPETGSCSCEASIGANSALTQSGAARIFVCPMTKPRVVWAWFGSDGRPAVFMETSAPGDDPAGVLTLVDYYSWEPNRIPDPVAFDIPAQCPVTKPEAETPASASHAIPAARRRCGACHLDGTAR
jgi:hypothetical protein